MLKRQLHAAQQLRDQLLIAELRRSPIFSVIKRVSERRAWLDQREAAATLQVSAPPMVLTLHALYLFIGLPVPSCFSKNVKSHANSVHHCIQAAIRLRMPISTRELETLSNTDEEEADPFSKFGDSSSEGHPDRGSSLDPEDFGLRSPLTVFPCERS